MNYFKYKTRAKIKVNLQKENLKYKREKEEIKKI